MADCFERQDNNKTSKMRANPQANYILEQDVNQLLMNQLEAKDQLDHFPDKQLFAHLLSRGWKLQDYFSDLILF